jgi:hypothetical protein
MKNIPHHLLRWKRRWFGYEARDGACLYEIWRYGNSRGYRTREAYFDVYRMIDGKHRGLIIVGQRPCTDGWLDRAKNAANKQCFRDRMAGRDGRNWHK